MSSPQVTIILSQDKQSHTKQQEAEEVTKPTIQSDTRLFNAPQITHNKNDVPECTRIFQYSQK